MLELDEVQQLRDDALIERLATSVRSDRTLAVRLLVEMGEVQARGLHRELGFASLFDFATRKLGMSEGEAGLRIRAAKVGRSFPEALELLARGEVTLTTLSLLAGVLTHESLHLLQAARGKSKQQVQAILAAHAPKPDAPDSVRRLPSPRASARAQRAAGGTVSPIQTRDVDGGTDQVGTAAPAQPHAGVTGGASNGALPLLAQNQPPPKAAAVVQLSANRHKISFTASQRVRDLMQEAEDLRRHRYPAGDLEPLFERALELLVAEEKKRKFALTEKPRATTAKRAAKHSRYIPHAVRRQAWARHDGRCCFIAASGQRCQARSRLEFHHVVPFARGGATDADNLVLLCQAHNALLAERDYGRAFIQARVEHRASGSGAPMILERPAFQVAAAAVAHQPQAP
jgi:hypothetical protein